MITASAEPGPTSAARPSTVRRTRTARRSRRWGGARTGSRSQGCWRPRAGPAPTATWPRRRLSARPRLAALRCAVDAGDRSRHVVPPPPECWLPCDLLSMPRIDRVTWSLHPLNARRLRFGIAGTARAWEGTVGERLARARDNRAHAGERARSSTSAHTCTALNAQVYKGQTPYTTAVDIYSAAMTTWCARDH